MKKTLRFVKLMDKWFVDLPELNDQITIYDCEMVKGADTLLDTMAFGRRELFITVSNKSDLAANIVLNLKADNYEAIEDGRYYTAIFYEDDNSVYKEFDLWLCRVLYLVFGEYPDKLYIYEY